MKRQFYHKVMELVAPGACQERRDLRLAIARSRLESERLTRMLNKQPDALANALKGNPWHLI